MEDSSSKVEAFSRAARWKVKAPYGNTERTSDPFKLGLWTWCLSRHINKSQNYVKLCLVDPPSYKRTKIRPDPIATFVFVISNPDSTQPSKASDVFNRTFHQVGSFCSWDINDYYHDQLVIMVSFLDIKIGPVNGIGKSISIWSCDEDDRQQIKLLMQQIASSPSSHQMNVLKCLFRMLEEDIHTDVTIRTGDDGNIRAHKALLSAISPVFQNMFSHDFKEKLSSTIDINDMSLESCKVLLSYLYGNIHEEDLLKHRLALLDAANKYDIPDLKDDCEKCLVVDIKSENVLERLEVAWIYKLEKLKKACFELLFDGYEGTQHRDDIANFIMHADKELIVEIFQEVFNVLKPKSQPPNHA